MSTLSVSFVSVRGEKTGDKELDSVSSQKTRGDREVTRRMGAARAGG